MHKDRRVKIAEHLLTLTRGTDQLLLANYANLRFPYWRQGRRYVASCLRATSELGSRQTITAAFPQDVPLLDTLLGRGILAPCPLPRAGVHPVSGMEASYDEARRSLPRCLLKFDRTPREMARDPNVHAEDLTPSSVTPYQGNKK